MITGAADDNIKPLYINDLHLPELDLQGTNAGRGKTFRCTGIGEVAALKSSGKHVKLQSGLDLVVSQRRCYQCQARSMT